MSVALRSLASLLGTLHILLVFGIMLVCCNLLLVISWLFVRPISEKWHQRLLCHCTSRWSYNYLLDWAQTVGGLSIHVSGDVEALLRVHTGSKIVISNHVSYTDSFIVYGLARMVGQHGQLRSFAKRSLVYMPAVGWFWAFLNFIFLSRDWDKDRAYIAKQLINLKRISKMYFTQSFWLLIFPEGTRFRNDKQEKGAQFSKERGLPVFENTLVPRVKGFQSSLESVRDSIDGIVDVTIGYSVRTKRGSALPSVGMLFFSGFDKSWPIHVHVRVIPIAQVPTEPEKVSAWTMELFQEKDKLLSTFKAEGKFPGTAVPCSPTTPFQTVAGLAYGIVCSAVVITLPFAPAVISFAAAAAGFAT